MSTPLKSATLGVYANNLDGLAQVEYQNDPRSRLFQVATTVARAFGNVQTALDPLVRNLGSALSEISAIQTYLNSLLSYETDLGGTVTLTNSLQSLALITVQESGVYLIDAAVSIDFRNDDVASIELDINGTAHANKIAMSSTVAGLQLTTVLSMHWRITTGQGQSTFELKAKKSAGTGATAVITPTVLRALRIA